MKRSLTLLLLTLLISQLNIIKTLAQTVNNTLPSQQLMVVITSDWDNPKGHIYAFEKHNDKWIPQFNNEVVVGSKGLGLGDGIIQTDLKNVPVKKEGDLKAPAGIFTIGTAFGYADAKDAGWIKNHYLKATDTLICVDDRQSANYNTLINDDSLKSDYKSFERMHRKDELYKWGLFINHNSTNTIAGNGSCIFMHIWRNSNTGTEGCTAMPEHDLLNVLHWIDAAKHPLLVQFPKGEYEQIRKVYDLPKLD